MNLGTKSYKLIIEAGIGVRQHVKSNLYQKIISNQKDLMVQIAKVSWKGKKNNNNKKFSLRFWTIWSLA